MRLATRRDARGLPQVSRVSDRELIDIPDQRMMVDLISQGPEAIERAIRVEGARTALGDAELLAPIPSPRRNVFCVGWNYIAHVEEGALARHGSVEAETPTFFTKATTTVIGPMAVIPAHLSATRELDWEVELAVVMGRECRNLSEDEASECVFGYMVANDVTARDLQRNHGGQWFKGKSLDGTCPTGPFLVTTDEVVPEDGLELRCSVNGVLKQRATTLDMAFPIARLLSELSVGLTLLPGDILLTGTPGGVGFARQPPEFLSAGDVLVSEIVGIGQLRNEIASVDLPGSEMEDPRQSGFVASTSGVQPRENNDEN